MKRIHYIIALCVVLAGVLSVAYQPLLNAASTITFEGILPNIYTGTSGSEALNIAMTQSTVGLDVSEETALTNTMNETMSLTHTTTGTPANGIGEKITFTQETSDSNNEDVGYIGFSMSDVTAASEDASFVVGNMAAGAAAATKFTVGSTGIVSLTGAATLDNTTSATELNITETTVQLTGAVNMDGGVVTVNQDSGDYDFVVESNDVADALKVDAGTNTVQFGSWISYELATSTAQSYSIASAGKASVHIQTAGEAATAHLMTDLLTSPGAGGVIILKTGDASDIVIDTEGSETINGAATYTIDGTQEAVTLITDGTNWHVISSYLE